MKAEEKFFFYNQAIVLTQSFSELFICIIRLHRDKSSDESNITLLDEIWRKTFFRNKLVSQYTKEDSRIDARSIKGQLCVSDTILSESSFYNIIFFCYCALSAKDVESFQTPTKGIFQITFGAEIFFLLFI